MPKLHPTRLLFLFAFLAVCLAGLIPLGAGEKLPNGVISALRGHDELVYTVDFSADGKYLVTGSFDNTIKLWDVASGKEIKTFGGPAGHTKMVLSVAVSPNGQYLASGAADNTLKLWDVPISTPIGTLTSNDGVSAVALSVDGKRLVIGGKDGLVKIFNTEDSKQLFEMKGHTGPVTGVAISANAQVVISSSADKTLRYWNATNGQAIATVGAHAGSANAVAINPNNTTAYSVGEDGTLKFWKVPPTAPKVLPDHADAVRVLALSPDNAQVLSGGAEKTLRVSTLANGQQVRVLEGANAAVKAAAYSATAIAAGTVEGRLVIWNSANGTLIDNVLAHTGSVNGVSFHPQNTKLLTAGSDGLMRVWTVPTIPAKSFANISEVVSAAVRADGKRILTGGADKIVRSWDVDKNVIEKQFAGHTGPVTAVATNANGAILLSGSDDATIRQWDPASGKEAGQLNGHAGAVTALDISAANTQALSAGADGTLKLWQLPLVATKAMTHPDQVTALVISTDGAKALTASADKQVRLWVLQTGAQERAFPGLTGPITAITLSGNGQLVAGASEDKNVIVWNAANGQEVKKFPMPTGALSVAIHPDGKTVAVGSADNSIRLVSLADGKELKKLDGHTAAVTALLYTAKGELISGSADKSARIWNPDGSAKATLAQGAVITNLSFSKDGKIVAAAGEKTAKLWNFADNKELATLTAPEVIRGIDVSPDGKRIALGCMDKLVRVYGPTGTLEETFTHDGPVFGVAFANPKLIVSASGDKTARAWTSALVWQQALKGKIHQARFNAKGDQIVAAGEDKLVHILQTADGKETKTIPAHDGAVVSVDWSTDGSKIVTAGADKNIKVWNPANEKQPLATMTLAAVPQRITITPDGKRIAVGFGDKESQVQVFNADLTQNLQNFRDHTNLISALQFLNDNRTLASGSMDKTARLSSLGVEAAHKAHEGGVAGVQYASSGTAAVSGGADKTVKVWDLNDGKITKTFGPLADPISAVAYNKAFTQVAAGAGKNVKIFTIADGKETPTITHPADVLSLSFSADNSKLATGAADKLVRAWDVATGVELEFFPYDDSVAAVIFNGNNDVLAGGGKKIRQDSLANQKAIAVGKEPIYALALAANGASVLTGGADKAVKLWNTANFANERTFAGSGAAIRAIEVAKNNLIVAAAGDDKIVRVYNFADAKEIKTVPTPDVVQALAFSPNSNALAAACVNKTLLSWDVTNPNANPLPVTFLSPIQSYTDDGQPTALVFAPDNATIYSTNLNKVVHLWKLPSPAPVKNFPHPNLVDSVTFSPDGKLLASGGHDGKIRIFDLVKGAQLKEINAHITANETMIYAVAFAPDSQTIVSASYDKSLKIWNVGSGALVREFKAYKEKESEQGHMESVFAVAFSPDGKSLASGSAGLERVIKLWNVADGKLIRELANPSMTSAVKGPVQSHPGWIYKLRFTRDGKYLVSAGDAPGNKGYLGVWSPADGKMLYGEAMPIGTFFGLSVSPDSKMIAIGAGPRGKATPEFNCAYLLKMPVGN